MSAVNPANGSLHLSELSISISPRGNVMKFRSSICLLFETYYSEQKSAGFYRPACAESRTEDQQTLRCAKNMQFSISQQSPEGKDELEMIQIMNIKILNASFTQNKWNFRMFLTQSYCMAWNIGNKSIGLILWCFLEIDRPSARSWKRTDKILVKKKWRK